MCENESRKNCFASEYFKLFSKPNKSDMIFIKTLFDVYSE